MKRIMIFALGLLLATGANAAKKVKTPKVDTLTVTINSMHCGKCANKVKAAVQQGEGVESVTCNLERNTATIVYNPKKVNADQIKERLVATKRYIPTAYSKDDVISRKVTYRIDDMHCGKCADRITKGLQQINGVDSLGADLKKHTFTVKYDANKTTRNDIFDCVNGLGYTPVTYSASPMVDYAYFNIPEEKANEETAEALSSIKGVADVNVNEKRKTVAITYKIKEFAAQKLLEEVQKTGVNALVPAPHECKDEK